MCIITHITTLQDAEAGVERRVRGHPAAYHQQGEEARNNAGARRPGAVLLHGPPLAPLDGPSKHASLAFLCTETEICQCSDDTSEQPPQDAVARQEYDQPPTGSQVSKQDPDCKYDKDARRTRHDKPRQAAHRAHCQSLMPSWVQHSFPGNVWATLAKAARWQVSSWI